MAILALVCFIVAFVLAALASLNVPSPRVGLLSAAVAFLSLGFALQSWGAVGG